MNNQGSTSALSPQEMRERAEALTKQAQQLEESSMNYEIGASPEPVDKKSSSASKNIINFSFIVFGVCGIVGSFWDAFDMSKYVEFLQVFTYIWGPLVVTIGSGMAVKNFVNKKYSPGSK